MASSELLTRAVAKVIPQKLAEEKLAAGKPIRMYWGIDPTGTKIHLGHTVPLRKMKAFAEAGHEVIMLIGSFTGMIGDPSDRDGMRQPLTKEQVEKNFQTYKDQAAKILDFSKVKIRYNHEWLEKLTYADIVQHASHFTVQQMMERDMFHKRWEEEKPIGSHEFLYPLMVGYDSVVLDVDCELGGTDQEFNMLAGRTLQKAYGKRDKFIMTMKLLLGTDGRKMSKTYDNCVYIDDAPNDMYGKILSIKDDLIFDYFEFCTDVPLQEIKAMAAAMKKGTNPKELKMRLAKEIVTMYHGASAAAEAESQFTKVFADKGVPDDMPELKVKKGMFLVDALMEAKVVASKSEARRLIEQKAVHVNDEVVTAIDAVVEKGIVKVGKRRFVKFL